MKIYKIDYDNSIIELECKSETELNYIVYEYGSNIRYKKHGNNVFNTYGEAKSALVNKLNNEIERSKFEIDKKEFLLKQLNNK